MTNMIRPPYSNDLLPKPDYRCPVCTQLFVTSGGLQVEWLRKCWSAGHFDQAETDRYEEIVQLLKDIKGLLASIDSNTHR